MVLSRLRGINVEDIIFIKDLQKECLFEKSNKGREMIIYKKIILWFFHEPKKKNYINTEISELIFKLVENKLLVR